MRNTFTPNDDEFIRNNYLSMPVKTMAKAINRSYCGIIGRMKKLALVIPPEIVERRKADSRIKPGNIPMNKGKRQIEYMSPESIERSAATRFKKGNKPHNTKFDGYERITKDGYIEIRIALGKFVIKHRYEWEKVNGPIPKGLILVSKTGDIKNCHPSNWELITMEENLRRNNNYDNPTDNRVASYLATSSRKPDRELRDELLKHPKIIEAKRNLLLINRKLKNHGKK